MTWGTWKQRGSPTAAPGVQRVDVHPVQPDSLLERRRLTASLQGHYGDTQRQGCAGDAQGLASTAGDAIRTAHPPCSACAVQVVPSCAGALCRCAVQVRCAGAQLCRCAVQVRCAGALCRWCPVVQVVPSCVS